MREIKEDADLVAYCGLYCGACGAFLKEKCNGCHKNEKASWCKIRVCCLNKKIATCAECAEFPEPNDCRKFNNIMSKIFGLIFRSNRHECVMQNEVPCSKLQDIYNQSCHSVLDTKSSNSVHLDSRFRGNDRSGGPCSKLQGISKLKNWASPGTPGK